MAHGDTGYGTCAHVHFPGMKRYYRGIMNAKTLAGRIIAFLVAATATMLTVQPVGAISIDRITGNPRAYVGEDVRLRGEVTNVRKVPLMDAWLVTVYDGTGTLMVISDREYQVAQRYRTRVTILGIATERAEEGSEAFSAAVAEFLVEKDIVDRERADRGAEAVVTFLRTLLPLFDVSLCAIERG